jgi:hypothetical protein
MQPPKLIAALDDIDATTLAEAAATIAVAISAAIHGDEVMVGPLSAISDSDGTFAVHLPLARRTGPLLFANLVPGTLDISSVKARDCFKVAIVAALARHFSRVRSFNSFRAMLDAAREPRDDRELMH